MAMMAMAVIIKGLLLVVSFPWPRMRRTLLTSDLDSPFALRSVVGDGDDGDGGNNQGFAPGRQFFLSLSLT